MVPGQKAEEQSSYGRGILAGIVFANKVCKDDKITEGKCTMGCDNQEALAASFDWKSPNPNWVCFDLVGMIRYHLRTSPIQWESKHIKGHRDDAKKIKDLTTESQANVIADKKAKEKPKKGNIPLETKYVKGQSWIAICEGQPVTGNVKQRLRILMQKEESRKWWVRKLKIDEEYTSRVAWDVYDG